MQDQLITIFITFLVVLDPIGVAPLFAALTRGGSDRYRRRMAFKGVGIATLILFLFVFTGDALLRFLGHQPGGVSAQRRRIIVPAGD
jgi:multiple antibiotic resistance protein